MNITDFLLARIAEDEALALASVERDVFAPTQGPDMARLHDDDEYDMLVVGAGHVLAECEAKRRIVELHANAGDCCECTPTRYPCPTLRVIARIYSDHPDYLEEWRP